MKAKSTFCIIMLFLSLFLLTGCSIGEKYGEGIMQAFDDLQNAEHNGGPFENNLDSARAYLLEQMQEKYGIDFTVIGDKDLENYGPFAGATYSCKVAPADAPEQVATALVSQTRYQDVRDGYAVYFFKEEAEEPVLTLCENKDYVIGLKISLEMPETAHTWMADDGLEKFLSESGAYVRLTLYLENDLDTKTYAEQILDFLHSIDQLNCNLFVQPRANSTYMFYAEAHILDGFDADNYTLEEIEKMVERRLKTGDPK